MEGRSEYADSLLSLGLTFSSIQVRWVKAKAAPRGAEPLVGQSAALSSGIIDLDEPVLQVKTHGQMSTQCLDSITLGRVVTSRDEVDPALARQMRGLLRDLA
jgi:hypothetical protein